jgi:uncharacterized protein
MRTKSFPARITLGAKADDEQATDEEDSSSGGTGTFEALVSVFGTKDSYGEVVMPGAFTRTLSEWETRGDPIPVYWSHRLDDPDFNIGEVLQAKETDEGLWVKAQLDMENPKAVATHNLLRSRRVTQFSFSFAVPPGGAKQGEDAIELNDLDLYEVGPTPIGANPDTQLIGVKAGRVLSAKNVETITDARTALKAADSALAALLKLSSGDDEKSAPARKATAEEPSRANAQELTVPSVDAVLALISLADL